MKKSAILKRFIRRKGSIAGCLILLFMFLVAAVGPFLTDKDPYEIDLVHTYAGVSADVARQNF